MLVLLAALLLIGFSLTYARTVFNDVMTDLNEDPQTQQYVDAYIAYAPIVSFFGAVGTGMVCHGTLGVIFYVVYYALRVWGLL